MVGKAIIGTSGWNYKHWGEGVFYPPGMRQAEWLPYYSNFFESVEINNTFYHLPSQEVFETWYKETPSQFVFSVKANRFLTHLKKLANPEKYLDKFLENISRLKEKVKVVLFQLPPFWKFHRERLEAFFGFLSQKNENFNLRFALEIRHKSWSCPECWQILEKYNVSLVFADWPGLDIDCPATADFIFMRRHGYRSLYATSYPDDYLKNLARQINKWLSAGKDVYVYFNNDACGYAIQNALSLKKYLRT
ncbi:MAG: DUF72 domain-containing protein [Thermodesulfobacteriota bacterium]